MLVFARNLSEIPCSRLIHAVVLPGNACICPLLYNMHEATAPPDAEQLDGQLAASCIHLGGQFNVKLLAADTAVTTYE